MPPSSASFNGVLGESVVVFLSNGFFLEVNRRLKAGGRYRTPTVLDSLQITETLSDVPGQLHPRPQQSELAQSQPSSYESQS